MDAVPKEVFGEKISINTTIITATEMDGMLDIIVADQITTIITIIIIHKDILMDAGLDEILAQDKILINTIVTKAIEMAGIMAIARVATKDS